MATFAKSTFNAVQYAASRPYYPPALYHHVISAATPFPSPPPDRTLLDLGCGPGLSTFSFLPHFARLIGLDPSPNMVNAANSILQEKINAGEVHKHEQVQFLVGVGEDLKAVGVEDDTVDLVVAGQAAHWFDTTKVYAELARVLKPGGSMVFWGYGEFYLPNHPKSSALIPPYSAGTLGPYWQQPGRSIVESLLVPLALPPSPTFTSQTRSFFLSDSPSYVPPSPETTHPLLLTQNWSLKEIEGYLKTFSAAHTYDEKHGDASDVGREFGRRLGDALKAEGVDVDAGEKILVAWRMGTVEARKA
ncbi:S-adenosyl-L-methionine-dependent methyltransferase [Meredithblackwellia eburnea MCA 4105]